MPASRAGTGTHRRRTTIGAPAPRTRRRDVHSPPPRSGAFPFARFRMRVHGRVLRNDANGAGRPASGAFVTTRGGASLRFACARTGRDHTRITRTRASVLHRPALRDDRVAELSRVTDARVPTALREPTLLIQTTKPAARRGVDVIAISAGRLLRPVVAIVRTPPARPQARPVVRPVARPAGCSGGRSPRCLTQGRRSAAHGASRYSRRFCSSRFHRARSAPALRN